MSDSEFDLEFEDDDDDAVPKTTSSPLESANTTETTAGIKSEQLEQTPQEQHNTAADGSSILPSNSLTELIRPSPFQTTAQAQLLQRMQSADAATKRYLEFRRLDEIAMFLLHRLVETTPKLTSASISTITGQFNLGKPIDLQALLDTAPHARLDQASQHQAKISLLHPPCKMSITKSGSVTIMGAKWISDSYLAARRTAWIAQSSNAMKRAEVCDFRITNIVITADLGQEFTLHHVMQTLERLGHSVHGGLHTNFNALTIKHAEPFDLTLRLFNTGKLLIMGPDSISKVIITLARWYTILTENNHHRIETTTLTVGGYTTKRLDIAEAQKLIAENERQYEASKQRGARRGGGGIKRSRQSGGERRAGSSSSQRRRRGDDHSDEYEDDDDDDDYDDDDNDDISSQFVSRARRARRSTGSGSRHVSLAGGRGPKRRSRASTGDGSDGDQAGFDEASEDDFNDELSDEGQMDGDWDSSASEAQSAESEEEVED